MDANLTAKFFCSIFDYDENAGTLRWKVRTDLPKIRQAQWNSRYAGKIAGTINDRGYVCVKIGKREYKSHRVIWMMTTGEWPLHDIDHINGIKSDNRLLNLRQATRRENRANTPAPKNSSSGIKGIHYRHTTKKWRASIIWHGQKTSLGDFFTQAEAEAAYRAASIRLHGEFAYVPICEVPTVQASVTGAGT